jgi:transcriptional regulator with XRE-family HTH domain
LVRAARGLLGWSQTKLANEARCSRNSVSRFEAGASDTKMSTVLAVAAALEQGGVIFESETESLGVGVRLRQAAPDGPHGSRRAGTSAVKRTRDTSKP